MKNIFLATLIALLAMPAHAQLIGNNGDDHSINGNNTGVQNTGTINGSTINNGAGSGSTDNHSSADAKATAAAKADSRSSASAKQAQEQKQAQLQGQSLDSNNSVEDSGNSHVEIKDRRQAPSIAAPGLTNSFGNDSCLGSASAGLSLAGFGGTVGSSTVDVNCVRLKNSERADRKGYKKAALYIMCQDEDFRAGMRYEADRCPQDSEQAAYVDAPAPARKTSAGGYYRPGFSN